MGVNELHRGKLVRVLKLDHDATEKEIERMIEHYDRLLLKYKAKDGMQLITVGFDDDPRELADIPEAVALLKRFMECGGLGLLVLGVKVKDLPDYTLPAMALGLGALEVWAIARGKVKDKGEGEETTIDLSEFKADYLESIRKYQSLCY